MGKNYPVSGKIWGIFVEGRGGVGGHMGGKNEQVRAGFGGTPGIGAKGVHAMRRPFGWRF